MIRLVKGKFGFLAMDAELIPWDADERKSFPNKAECYASCREKLKVTVRRDGKKGVTVAVFPSVISRPLTDEGGAYFIAEEEINKTQVYKYWQNHKYKYLV